MYKNNERFPFISGYDSNPTPVKYISFASKNTTLEYYFNCTENTEYDTGRDIIIKDSYPQKFNSLQLIPVNSDSLSGKLMNLTIIIQLIYLRKFVHNFFCRCNKSM